MTNWRARHYQLRITKRRTLHVTVRRFRRTSVPSLQHAINLRLGRVRQIVWQVRVKHRRGRPAGQVLSSQRRRLFASGLPVGLIAVGLIGASYCSYQLLRPRTLEPHRTFITTAAETISATPVAPLTLARSLPTHIAIPSQNIDVDITPVDRDSNGAIALPPLFAWLAGWYDLSPTPGELGPSIIVGHVDTYQGISVFWNLRYVQQGDTVAISRADGSTANFTITALEQYDQNNFPTQMVYGNTSDAELRIITCGGNFDTTTGHYTQNTVVYAKLVGKA